MSVRFPLEMPAVYPRAVLTFNLSTMVCQEGGPVCVGRTQQSRLKLFVPKLSDAAFGARPRLREFRKELAPKTLPAVGPGLWKLPNSPLSIRAVFPFPLRSA